MAESTAVGAEPASSSSSLSTVGAQQRKPLEDVILSPELPRRLTSSRPHAVDGRGHAGARPTRLRGQGAAQQHKKKKCQKPPKPLLTAQGLKRVHEDDMAAQRVRDDAVTTVSATLSDKTADSSSISERDSLLERLREKERQFDEKITALDETLSCAERGRLQRDNIIDGLRAEVARLRAQLELAASAKSQADELREKILRERTLALEEAHAKIEALHDTVREKDQRLKHLERELKLRQASIAAQSQKQLAAATTAERIKGPQPQRQEQQKQGTLRALSPNVDTVEERERERRKREHYGASLRALQEEVQALEQSYNVTRSEKDALAEENQVLRSKLEAIQEEIETRVAGAVKAMQSHVDQKRELEAEVVATRLGMARLLRLLGEVPEMRRYLRMAAIDDDMLFTGYTLAAVTSDRRTTSEEAGHPHYPRRRNGGLSALASGTGVDDGVYGGNLMLWSSNIYLNGSWCKQLQSIINDENNFLRRRKICIGDLEDAARCGRGGGDGPPRLPPASDVLQGRQHDKDFWIPYAVFVEAQKFKNRYFPTLSYECFYPFLIAVNQVWNDKTRRRVAAETRRRLYMQQQQQQREEKRCRAAKEQTDDMFPSNDSSRQLSSSATGFWQQLQQLRHEVRRRVTGKNSLELFRAYDHLMKCALKHLREVQEEHAALLERHRYCRLLGHTGAVMNVDEESKNRMISEAGEEGIGEIYDEASILLRRALSALVEEVQEISERSASRIETSCRDMQEFLEALRDQKLRTGPCQEQEQRLGEGDSGGLPHTQALDYVPVSTLLRVIDGVLDFVDEVRREAFAARNAVSRCATRADERSELLLVSAAADDESGAEYEEEGEVTMAMDN